MNMCPKTSRALLYLVSAFGLGALLGWSPPSSAGIQRIVIDQTATINFTPITLGTATPGTPTSYTVYVGRSFGEVNPSDPNNRSSPTSVLRRRTPAEGSNTLPTFRSSRRPIRHSATD